MSSRSLQVFLSIVIILLGAAAVAGQSAPNPPQSPATGAQSDPEASARPDDVPKRIERARALVAAHQLQTAAGELELVRKGAQEDSVRNVTSVMLMGIYLEAGNYLRAESLLEETFQLRSAKDDASIRGYFALAGQAINGARARVERYRSFGVNLTDVGLPTEVLSDLDQLRSLLERMISQAKQITGERKGYDSLALLEDVLGTRLSLSRDSEDRARWEAEYAGAREVLASSTQSRIASRGELRSLPPSTRNTSSPAREAAIASSNKSAETSPDKQSVSSKGTSAAATTSNTTADGSAPSADSQSAERSGTLSTGLLNPRATKKVAPSYPPNAKAAGAEGVVRVYVTLREDGKVIDVSRSEGPVLLREAAEQAALQWKFPPTMVAGKTVRLSGYIEFNFTP